MKLNRVEQLLMNNPVRAAVQRNVDAALLERLGGRLDGRCVLEVGCGRGVGVEILWDRFQAGDVHAFDLDPIMVEAARRRLAKRNRRHGVHLTVGDVAAIPYPDATFDAVVDFGAIHHISDWRAAVSEVRRVLRPGGRFYFWKVTRQCLERWVVRTLLTHPSEERFSGAEFIVELEDRSIAVQDNFVQRLFGDIVVGVGVARISEPTADNRTGDGSGLTPLANTR